MPLSGNRTSAPILITMGEPSGIGPEVALAAFAHFGGKVGRHPLTLVGDAKIFASRKDALIPTTAPVVAIAGRPDEINAAAVTQAIAIPVPPCPANQAPPLVT